MEFLVLVISLLTAYGIFRLVRRGTSGAKVTPKRDSAASHTIPPPLTPFHQPQFRYQLNREQQIKLPGPEKRRAGLSGTIRSPWQAAKLAE